MLPFREYTLSRGRSYFGVAAYAGALRRYTEYSRYMHQFGPVSCLGSACGQQIKWDNVRQGLSLSIGFLGFLGLLGGRIQARAPHPTGVDFEAPVAVVVMVPYECFFFSPSPCASRDRTVMAHSPAARRPSLLLCSVGQKRGRIEILANGIPTPELEIDSGISLLIRCVCASPSPKSKFFLARFRTSGLAMGKRLMSQTTGRVAKRAASYRIWPIGRRTVPSGFSF